MSLTLQQTLAVYLRDILCLVATPSRCSLLFIDLISETSYTFRCNTLLPHFISVATLSLFRPPYLSRSGAVATAPHPYMK